MPEKKLYRSLHNRVIAGVCGGIGEYFDIDPVIVRLIWVVTAFMGGAGLIFYVLAWIIIPEGKNEGTHYTARDEDIYRGADAQNSETRSEGVHEGSHYERHAKNAESTKMIVALAFIVFGVILLFSKLLNWDFFSWKYFFGILFVIIGGGIIYKFFRENKK